MAVPQFLILEMRIAFRQCAQQHQQLKLRCFSTSRSSCRQSPRTPSAPKPPPHKPKSALFPYNAASITPAPTLSSNSITRSQNPSPAQKGLVPQEQNDLDLDLPSSAPRAPIRPLPPAQVGSSSQTLSPTQRLHIEFLTRKQPRSLALSQSNSSSTSPNAKPLYRERIQVYHIGALRENWLAILKVSTLVCLSATTFIIGPAHYSAGSDPFLVSSIFLGGFVPLVLINYWTMGYATRVFLEIPLKSRVDSKSAIEYARNLPSDAVLGIRYLRPWATEGGMTCKVSELVALDREREGWKAWLRPLSVKRIEGGEGRREMRDWLKPKNFYFMEKTEEGRRSKNTVPGLWGRIYERIMGRKKKEEIRWVRGVAISQTGAAN